MYIKQEDVSYTSRGGTKLVALPVRGDPRPFLSLVNVGDEPSEEDEDEDDGCSVGLVDMLNKEVA